MRCPVSVIRPSASKAPITCSCFNAAASCSTGGRSRKSKFRTSSWDETGSDLRCSTAASSDVRRISGGVTAGICSSNVALGYSRKHCPGWVRPARPARWTACTRLMRTTSSESMLVAGLNCFCLTKPGSTTYTTPGTVSEVSATLVAQTILRV